MLAEAIVAAITILAALAIIREPWRRKGAPEEQLPPGDVVAIHTPKIASLERRAEALERRVMDLENRKALEDAIT